MKLDARLGRLERRATDDPSLVQPWVAMMTALIVAAQGGEDMTPEAASELRAQAREYVRRGIPATISDWFRELRALADTEEVRA